MTQDRSLKTTVLWFIYALVIGVSFLTFVPSYLQQRNTLRAEYLARGKALAKNLNYNSRQPLLSKDYKALYALVDSLMREPDIHWVAIQDAAGRVVAQNGADRIQWQKGEPDSGEKAEQVRIRPYELGRNETVLDIQVENVVKEQPVAESGSPAELMFLEGLTEQPGKAAVSQEKYLGTVHVGLSLKSMQAKQRRLTWLLGLVLIIAMILGTGAGLYFSNTFLQPINQLVGIMENIASNQGDLTRRIDLHRRDELGKLAEAFNRFLGNLRQIVANTIALINRMNESVEEVAATSEQVNGTADAINTSVRAFIEDLQRQEEETTATTTMLNQVTAALQDTTQKSEGASRLFMETENLSEQGKKTVQDSVSHIDGITENMGVIERRMQNLTNSLDEIGSFVVAIRRITTQTNMLSLNASIESARAGDAGRGFQVVAEEIRKLAEHAAGSSEQIQTNIAKIRDETLLTVKATHEGTSAVHTGRDTVYQAGEALQRILQQANQAAEASMAISEDMVRQSEVLKTMMERIRDIEALGKKNFGAAQSVAASVQEQTSSLEQITSSLQRLSQDSLKVRNMIVEFKID